MTQTKEPVVPVPATDLTASPRQPLGRSFYNPLGHALELQRGLEDALATRVEPADFGTAIFRDELRRVASLNLLRVEGPRPNVAAADLMAEADRLQAGLPHRAVRVEDESDGIRVAPGFGASGWVPRRSAVMALRRLPDRPVGFDEVGYMHRFVRPWGDEDALPLQV